MKTPHSQPSFRQSDAVAPKLAALAKAWLKDVGLDANGLPLWSKSAPEKSRKLCSGEMYEARFELASIIDEERPIEKLAWFFPHRLPPDVPLGWGHSHAIWLAAQSGNVDACDFFISLDESAHVSGLGADGLSGEPPLFVACFEGQSKCAAFLAKKASVVLSPQDRSRLAEGAIRSLLFGATVVCEDEMDGMWTERLAAWDECHESLLLLCPALAIPLKRRNSDDCDGVSELLRRMRERMAAAERGKLEACLTAGGNTFNRSNSSRV